MLKIMLKKALNIFISILLLLPLFIGEAGLFEAVSHASPSFQKTCDMDDCNPYMPKCPLCPSSNSTIQLFHQEAAAYLPTPISSFILISVSALSDQGVVKAIFHPPTLNS
jgi:hypothetical protein